MFSSAQDAKVNIHVIDDELVDRADVGKLGVGGETEEGVEVVMVVGGDLQEGVSAGEEGFFVEGFHEGQCRDFAADADDVSFFDGRGIVDEDGGEFV